MIRRSRCLRIELAAGFPYSVGQRDRREPDEQGGRGSRAPRQVWGRCRCREPSPSGVRACRRCYPGWRHRSVQPVRSSTAGRVIASDVPHGDLNATVRRSLGGAERSRDQPQLFALEKPGRQYLWCGLAPLRDFTSHMDLGIKPTGAMGAKAEVGRAKNIDPARHLRDFPASY